MTIRTRALILSLFILTTSTGAACLIDVFLTVMHPELSKVAIYAPLASIITNVISYSVISDPVFNKLFVASTEYMSIQLVVFLTLVFFVARFALTRQNLKGLGTIILCSLFAVPGIAIMEASAAYLYYRAPDVNWGPFNLKNTAIQAALSIPFYALLFFAGTLVVTDDEHPTAKHLGRRIE
jgi:hypothetical protein